MDETRKPHKTTAINQTTEVENVESGLWAKGPDSLRGEQERKTTTQQRL